MDFQLFHASNLTSYHFYFEVLISLRPEVNNLYVYIILLSQSCSYNKIHELHNHEPTATYCIFNILLRDVNRSINRLKFMIEKLNGLILNWRRMIYGENRENRATSSDNLRSNDSIVRKKYELNHSEL